MCFCIKLIYPPILQGWKRREPFQQIFARNGEVNQRHAIFVRDSDKLCVGNDYRCLFFGYSIFKGILINVHLTEKNYEY